VLIGLCSLFVVVDFSFNFSKLPPSSNLQVLYVFYMFLYSLFVIYPLALVFSFLITLNSMIKFNELVSFYSLGFLPKKLIKPFFLSAFFIFIIMSIAQCTKITYANQYAQAIKNNMNLKNKNLFLKFNNNIVFIKELNPILKIAYDVKVFEIVNSKVVKVISTKKAVFRNNEWHSIASEILVLKNNKWQKFNGKISFLKNFKPKILSNLKTLDNISFYDAYLTIRYFKDIDLNKILSIVFFKIFTPLTMIAFIVYIFVVAPIHIRVSNISLFMIKSVTFSIFLWASELLLFKFAKQGILAFYVLILPFVLVLAIDFYILRRNNEF